MRLLTLFILFIVILTLVDDSSISGGSQCPAGYIQQRCIDPVTGGPVCKKAGA